MEVEGPWDGRPMLSAISALSSGGSTTGNIKSSFCGCPCDEADDVRYISDRCIVLSLMLPDEWGANESD